MQNAPGLRDPQASMETSGPPELKLTPVLERLGPSPFPRSGFPLMGFLATLYDHVAEYAREQLETDPGPPPD